MKAIAYLLFAITLFTEIIWAENLPTPTKPTPTKPTPEILARGKVVFSTSCVVCHGVSGNGDGPAGLTLKPHPRNFQTDKFKNGSAPNQIFETITKGLPGTAMASFASIPTEDRWALAFYVAGLKAGTVK